MKLCIAFYSLALASLGILSSEAQNIWPPEDEIVAVEGTRLTALSKERFRDGEWEEVNREVFVYDESGLLTERHYSSLFGEEWRVTRREKYSYSDGLLTGVLKEDKRINVFHPTEQRTLVYSDDRLQSWTTDAYGPGAEVIPVFRYSHSYQDDDSTSTETITQEQSMNGVWKKINTVRRLSDSSGRYIRQVKVSGADPSAEAGEQFVYEYDENGRLKSRRWSFRGDDGWFVPSDERYVYLEDGTILIESLRSIGGETAKTHRVVLERNVDGNVISRLYEGWQDGDWVSGCRELFSYESEE